MSVTTTAQQWNTLLPSLSLSLPLKECKPNLTKTTDWCEVMFTVTCGTAGMNSATPLSIATQRENRRSKPSDDVRTQQKQKTKAGRVLLLRKQNDNRHISLPVISYIQSCYEFYCYDMFVGVWLLYAQTKQLNPHFNFSHKPVPRVVTYTNCVYTN